VLLVIVKLTFLEFIDDQKTYRKLEYHEEYPELKTIRELWHLIDKSARDARPSEAKVDGKKPG